MCHSFHDLYSLQRILENSFPIYKHEYVRYKHEYVNTNNDWKHMCTRPLASLLQKCCGVLLQINRITIALIVGQKKALWSKNVLLCKKRSAPALSRVIMHSRKKVKWRERIYWMFWRNIRPIFCNHMACSSKYCNHHNWLVWTICWPLFASLVFFGLFLPTMAPFSLFLPTTAFFGCLAYIHLLHREKMALLVVR